MPDGLFGLSTNPANFGIDQPPDQGSQEAQRASLDIQQQLGVGFQQNMERMAEIAARSKAQQIANYDPGTPSKMSVVTDPKTGQKKINVDLTEDQMRFFTQAANFQKEALGGFAQQAAQLEQQLQRAQSQPWQQLATALAANMANQPNMPGWVRGMGQTAAQLNPTVDQLRARYLATMGQGADIARGVRAEDIAEKRTEEDKNQRLYSEALRADALRRSDVEKKFDNAMQEIKSGTGEVDAKAIQDGLASAGALPKELDSMMAQLDAVAKSVQKKFLLEREDRKQAQELAEKNYQQREKNITRLGSQFHEMVAAQDRRQEERMGQALYLAQNATYKQNTRIDVAESTAIRSAFNVIDLSSKLDDVAKTAKPDRITGTLQYKNPFRPGEWQAMKVYSTQLLLSGLAGKLGAGVSDRDVEVMKTIVPGGNLTPAQFLATQKVLRTVNEGNLVRMMEINPNVQFWKTTKPLFKKAGLEQIYEREMTNMEGALSETYPALFGPTRSKLAEAEYGPMKTQAAAASKGVDYQAEAAKLQPGQMKKLPDGTLIGKDPSGQVLISKGQ